MSRKKIEIFIARRISSQRGETKNVMIRIAVATIAVGMAVMILAMAVIRGFREEITNTLSGFGSHVRVVSLDAGSSFESSPVRYDTTLIRSFRTIPHLYSVFPYAVKGGIIKTSEAIQGVMLKGVPDGYDFSFFTDNLLEGNLPRIGDSVRRKDLLISRKTADLLSLKTGDRVELLFVSDALPVRRDLFQICGIFASGMDELDKTITLTDIRNVQRLNGWDTDQITGYEIMTDRFDRLEEVTEALYEKTVDPTISPDQMLKVEDIVSLNPNIFDWLRAHNVNAAVIIVIMLLVALLNMISALLIILLEKTAMIGTLKALGMRNRPIRRIFLLRSLRIILYGLLWGNLVGLSLALLQKYTHLVKLDSSGYMLSEVPVSLQAGWWIELNIGVPLVILTLLMIPVMAVSRITPEKTIRYQ